MGIHAFGGGIGEVYYGSAPIKEVYYGSDLVWQKRETVVFKSSSSLFAARDQLRNELTARGLDYKTVKSIPFDIDLTVVSNARYLFQNYAALEVAPKINTTGVTRVDQMFDGCTSLKSVPPMDLSAVTDFDSMFLNCVSLTSLPDFNVSAGTYFTSMFRNCKGLTDGKVRLIRDSGTVKDGMSMLTVIQGSGLTRLPFYDKDFNPIEPTY